MEKDFAVISLGIAVAMEIFTVLYPKTVREYFIKDYKNNRFKWSDAPTWMESKHGDVVFRAAGIVFLLLSLFSLYNFLAGN